MQLFRKVVLLLIVVMLATRQAIGIHLEIENDHSYAVPTTLYQLLQISCFANAVRTESLDVTSATRRIESIRECSSDPLFEQVVAKLSAIKKDVDTSDSTPLIASKDRLLKLTRDTLDEIKGAPEPFGDDCESSDWYGNGEFFGLLTKNYNFFEMVVGIECDYIEKGLVPQWRFSGGNDFDKVSFSEASEVPIDVKSCSDGMLSRYFKDGFRNLAPLTAFTNFSACTFVYYETQRIVPAMFESAKLKGAPIRLSDQANRIIDECMVYCIGVPQQHKPSKEIANDLFHGKGENFHPRVSLNDIDPDNVVVLYKNRKLVE